MPSFIRPAWLAFAFVATAMPASAQTWIYEADVPRAPTYEPRYYYEPRPYEPPTYESRAYRPAATAAPLALTPAQRTTIYRTIIPQGRGRGPIVRERIVTEPVVPAPVVRERVAPADSAYPGSADSSALALLLLGSVGFAAAQQRPPESDAQQRLQQENWQHTPSGKMGKEEPSSHAAETQPQPNAAFVNGALAVPDAPANTDTVPAKFSQKNAADDQLITTAYTFKTLSDDERRAIYEALKGQPAGSAFSADIGTELPRGSELRPVPDELAARVPQTKDYTYAG